MASFDEIQRALDGSHGDNATLYARTAALVRDANFPSTDDFAFEVITRFLARCDELGVPKPHYNVAVQMLRCVAGLYYAERFTDLPPNPALYGIHADNAVLGQIRDELIRLQVKAFHPEATLTAFAETIASSFVEIARALPRIARSSPHATEEQPATQPTIKLIDLMPDIGSIVERTMQPFLATTGNEFGLFRWIRNALDQNARTAAENTRSARRPSPSTFGGSAAETVEAFLGGTPLERVFLESSIPFELPTEQRFSGHWVIAPPGRGKTTLLHSMFLDDLDRDASIIVMDSKGDLINPIKSLAAVKDRLVLIEPDAEQPLALNPLDVPAEGVPHTIALIEYILSGLLDAKFTNLQSALFRHVVPAILQAIPHPTIETLKDVLAHGFPQDRVSALDPRLKQFFTDQRSGFDSKTYAETRSQIIWRLDFILTNDTMRAMFASPTTRLKLSEAMNDGKIILIDASKAVLGDDGSEFYQRFFLALILAAAQQRAKLAPAKKKPVYCYLDECQWVRNDQKLATILDECRSQKIALILAHQRTEQITNPNVLSAISNCAIRMANSDDEAKYLAPKLRTTTEFLYSLPRGTFATFVRDLTPAAIALDVPRVDLSELPQMTDRERREIRRRMLDEFSFRPSDIEPPVSAPDIAPPAASSNTAPLPPKFGKESGDTW